MKQPKAAAEGKSAAAPPIGSKVFLAGNRRRWVTEGKVVAQLRNGWLVVDFPACCWIGEPAKLELAEDPPS